MRCMDIFASQSPIVIYDNDMSAVVKNKLLLYADDSAILVSGKNKNSIESVLGSELETVSEWLIGNKLSLHLGKTESILFGSKQRLHKAEPSLNISCNGHPIASKDSVKYLGATIDQCLSFEDMVTSIIKKANARLKFLYRKRVFLTKHTKRLLVLSLIQCHFDYASPVWFYGISQHLKNKLQVTQNKLVRFILNLDPRSHVGHDHFVELSWLPVASRVDFKTLGQVYNIHNQEAPSYLMEHFKPVTLSHHHNTRFRVKVQNNQENSFSFTDSGRFLLPKVKGFGKLSFAWNGCTLWNNLPQHLRDIKSMSLYKSNVKAHLLSKVPV